MRKKDKNDSYTTPYVSKILAPSLSVSVTHCTHSTSYNVRIVIIANVEISRFLSVRYAEGLIDKPKSGKKSEKAKNKQKYHDRPSRGRSNTKVHPAENEIM